MLYRTSFNGHSQGVNIKNQKSPISVSNCKFNSHHAVYHLQLSKTYGTLHIDFSKFSIQKEHAIYLEDMEFVSINRCKFNTTETLNSVLSIRVREVRLTDTIFQGEKNMNFRGNSTVFIANSEKVEIRKCNFTNFLGTIGGGLYFKGNRLEITNTNFSNNTAIDGAGAYIEGSWLKIDGASFRGNEASKNGGGLVYDTLNSAGNTVGPTIENTEFVENIANQSGGAFYWNYVPPDIVQNSSFTNNAAPHGNNIGSPAVAILVQRSNSSSDSYIASNLNQRTADITESFLTANQWSWRVQKCAINNDSRCHSAQLVINSSNGSCPSGDLTVALYDIYGNIVKSDQTTIIKMVPKSLAGIPMMLDKRIKQVKVKNGVADFTSIQFEKAPGSHEDYEFSFTPERQLSAAIQKLLSVVDVDPTEIALQARFTECGEAEVVSSDGVGCEVCSGNTYAKVISGTNKRECTACPPNTGYCSKGRLWPLEGYWRENKTADELHICPYQKACNQFLSTFELERQGDRCGRYHTGRLCASCVVGFAHNELKLPCTRCRLQILEMGKFLLLLIQAIIIIVQIRGNAEAVENFNLICKPDTTHETIELNMSLRKFSASLKVLMLYSQVLALFMTFISSSDNPVNLRVIRFSFDCLFQGSSEDLLTRAQNIVFWRTITPFLILVLSAILSFLLCVLLRYVLKKLESFEDIIDQTINCWTVLFFSLQPSIVKSALNLLACRTIGSARFMTTALDIECGGEFHEKLLNTFALPSLAFGKKLSASSLLEMISKCSCNNSFVNDPGSPVRPREFGSEEGQYRGCSDT
eukprot:TRINITY_DN2341_c0_g3_i6.p1 TRINITY_DN2341_c0_g3~~TRINITY_DN2341_c0_g3_i6.p1  ORF type:complete len:810 (-),score=73.43 TRINITY_DN2341_c0_g3_i6:814-3243(-)